MTIPVSIIKEFGETSDFGITRLSERYADVKKWVLLAEEMADKFPIASVNEFPDALDHFK